MWKVLIEQHALDFLDSLPPKRKAIVKESLKFLKESPYPGRGRGDKKEIEAASKRAYRMRIGDYRAFYVIEETPKTVKVTELMTAEAAHKKYGRL